MAKSIALDDGHVGNYVVLPGGEKLKITARKILTDTLRSGSTQFFYQLGPEKDGRYLEVTVCASGVSEVRLSTGAPPPPDSDKVLDEMLTVMYGGKRLPRANEGLGLLFNGEKSEGLVSWVRFYSPGQREPGTTVVTVTQQVSNDEITHHGGVILTIGATHITES